MHDLPSRDCNKEDARREMLEREDLIFEWVDLRCLGEVAARLKKSTLCCVHCALWKIKVWAGTLDMPACAKAVRAES